MRQLVAGAFVTLDGVMQAPGGPDEDREAGFTHGGWLVPYFDEAFGRIQTDWTNRAGAFLLGRKTAEMFAASWPKSTDPDDALAAALNSRPKYVASRTLDRLGWQNTVIVDGDVVAAVRALKEGREVLCKGAGDGAAGVIARTDSTASTAGTASTDGAAAGNHAVRSTGRGEIQVHGSSDLLQTLLKHDLVDVLRIWQFPVVVGGGKRLFGAGAIPRSFHLIEMEANSTGAILMVYQRVGGLRYGEVEVGEEIRLLDPED